MSWQLTTTEKRAISIFLLILIFALLGKITYGDPSEQLPRDVLSSMLQK